MAVQRLSSLLLLPIALISCAAPQPKLEVSVAAPVAIPERPKPPAGVYGSLAVPPLGPDGAYLTPNRGLNAAQQIWHFRAAMNVAALSCRGDAAPVIVSSYNAMLKAQSKPLSSAYNDAQAQYRKNWGKDWQTRFDKDMTKLYNFFAQPAAQAGFCVVAADLVTQAAVLPQEQLVSFAPQALATVEEPFTNVYRDYQRYRTELAQWEAQHGASATALGASPPADTTAGIAARPAATAGVELSASLGN